FLTCFIAVYLYVRESTPDKRPVCEFIVHKLRRIFAISLLKCFFTLIQIHLMRVLAPVILCLLASSAGAQGVFKNQTHTALQQVISDFPYQFRNIRGEL